MNELSQNWDKVIDAFAQWWSFESTEFGPQVQYLSREELLKFTHEEMLSYIEDLRDNLIANRISQVSNCRLAIEDVLSVVSGPEYIEILQSMIAILDNLDQLLMKFSDILTALVEAIDEKDYDEMSVIISELLDIETEIRHYMSIFSQGFNKMETLGLRAPDFI